MDEQAEDDLPKETPTKDRRDHESWLHDALELSLHHRFQLGEIKGHERALILHGQRSRAHPDFALLDANQKLILVELKVGKLSKAGANEVVEQMRRYVKAYRKHTLAELAKWYCQHGVDVNTRFGYRNEKYITKKNPDDGFDYGRLNRWVLDSLKRYRGPFGPDKTDALAILEVDYQQHVGAKLDVSKRNRRLEVDRCILVAQEWPPKLPPVEIEGVNVELWTYPPPAEWVGPSSRRTSSSAQEQPEGGQGANDGVGSRRKQPP